MKIIKKTGVCDIGVSLGDGKIKTQNLISKERWDELIEYANSGGENNNKYPEGLNFEFENNQLSISVINANDLNSEEEQQDKYRMIDGYTLKLLAVAKENKLYSEEDLNILIKLDKIPETHLETLRRRFSYFNIYNQENFTLKKSDKSIKLYDKSELFDSGEEKPKLNFSISNQRQTDWSQFEKNSKIFWFFPTLKKKMINFIDSIKN